MLDRLCMYVYMYVLFAKNLFLADTVIMTLLSYDAKILNTSTNIKKYLKYISNLTNYSLYIIQNS